MAEYSILVINTGSTSTQVGIYENDKHIFSKSWSHISSKNLNVDEQYEIRKKAVYDTLEEAGMAVEDFHAVAVRGGRLKPIESGTYLSNEEMLKDSYSKEHGNHAGRLAVIIGREIGDAAALPVYTVDPISVDEMIDAARYSGMPEIPRKSLGHMLNTKAVARKAAKELGISYEEANFMIAHLGGGTTISGHINGRMVEIINDFEGCMTPERSGGLPNQDLVRLCFSGMFTEEEIIKKIEGAGGFYAYLGTKDLQEVEERIKKREKLAAEIMDAYLFQLIKVMGSIAAVLKYQIDAIIITGNIAKSTTVINHIEDVFGSTALIKVYPGSFELEALASGVFRVLKGDERAKSYSGGEYL